MTTADDDTSVTLVTSRDGTEIAYWTSGDGPPLVLVHGAISDHARWRPLLPYLEPHAMIHAIDRRGRGASGDGPDYRVEREFEDVAALVEAIAQATGSSVDVYGHSFGGLCAFGAATLTPRVRRLVLYEGWPMVNRDSETFPPGVRERLDALLAEGNRDAAVELVCRELAMMSEDEIAAFRAQPAWQARMAAAHTVTREIEAIADTPFDPEQAAKITAPTLMLTGADSSDPSTVDIDTVAAALPEARVVVLDGQQHVADVLAPELFAEHVVTFLCAPG